MLRCVSSRELALWRAYEAYEGPVGPVYERAALRVIASLLNGDEKAKPFPTPIEFMNPPVTHESSGTTSVEEADAFFGGLT